MGGVTGFTQGYQHTHYCMCWVCLLDEVEQKTWTRRSVSRPARSVVYPVLSTCDQKKTFSFGNADEIFKDIVGRSAGAEMTAVNVHRLEEDELETARGLLSLIGAMETAYARTFQLLAIKY